MTTGIITQSINNSMIYKFLLFTMSVFYLIDGVFSTPVISYGPTSGPSTIPVLLPITVTTTGPTSSPGINANANSSASTGSTSIIIYAALGVVGILAIILIIYSLYYRKIKILEAGEEVLLDFGNAYPNAGDKDGPKSPVDTKKGRKPGQGKIEAQLESGVYFENEMRRPKSPAKPANEASKPLSALSVPEVAYLMVALNFAQFAKSFVNSEISGEMLAQFNVHDDLTKAGVVMPAPFARSLLKVLAECKEKGVPLRFIKVREIYTSTKPTKEDKTANIEAVKPTTTQTAVLPTTTPTPAPTTTPSVAAVDTKAPPVAAVPAVDKKPPPPPPPLFPKASTIPLPPLVKPTPPVVVTTPTAAAPSPASTLSPTAVKSPQLAGAGVAAPYGSVAWTPKPKLAPAPIPTGPKYPRKPDPPTEKTKPLVQVTLNEVNRLLASLDLNEYAPSFIANGVNGRKLNDLNSEKPEDFKENCKVNMSEDKAIVFLLDLTYFKTYGVPMSRFEKGFPPSSPTLLAQLAPLPPEEKPKIPDPVLGDDAKLLADLTVEEVSSMLVSLKLQAFVDTFRNNNVNGFLLSEVTSVEELKECGVSIPGPFARTLLKDVAEFKATGVPLALIKVEVPVKLASNAKKLADLTVEEVGLLLVSIKLPQFVTKFAEGGINGFILTEVKSNEELKECGVTIPGPFAKSLFKEIEPFRSAGVPLDRIQPSKAAEVAVKPTPTSPVSDKNQNAVVPLQTLNVSEVAYLLVGLNLGAFARSFIKKEIDGLTLSDLKYPADVAALGVPMPDDVALSLLNMLEKCKSKGVPLKMIQAPEKPVVEPTATTAPPPAEPTVTPAPTDNTRVPLISLSTIEVSALLLALNLGSFAKTFIKNDITGLILSELKTYSDIIAIGIEMPEATAKSLLQVIEKCNSRGVPTKLIQVPGAEKVASTVPPPAPVETPTVAPTPASEENTRVPVISLNAYQVGLLLASLNLATFSPTFVKNGVTGLILSEMKELSDLVSIGISMPDGTAKSLLQVIEKCNSKGVPAKFVQDKSSTPPEDVPVVSTPAISSTPTPPPITKPDIVSTPLPTPAIPVAVAATPTAAPAMIELSKLSIADVAVLMTSLNMPSVAKIFQSKNIDGPALGKLVTLESVTATGVPESSAKPLMGVLEKCRTKGVPSKLLPNFRLSVAAAPTIAPAPIPATPATSQPTSTASAEPATESVPTKPLQDLSIVEVGKMLDFHSLSKYVPSFVQSRVNGFVLSEVTSVDELKNCGVTMPGPFARSLLTELTIYREKGVPFPVIGKIATQPKVVATPPAVPKITTPIPPTAAPSSVTKPAPSVTKPVAPTTTPPSVTKPVAPTTAPPSITKSVAAPTPTTPVTVAASPAAVAPVPAMIELSKLSVTDVATLMTSLNMPSVATIFQSKTIDGPALGKLVTLESVIATGVPEATAKPLMGVLEKCRTKGVPSKLLPNFRLSIAAAPTSAPASKPAAPIVAPVPTSAPLSVTKPVTAPTPATPVTVAATPAPAAPAMIELSKLSVADVAALMTSLNMPSVATIFQSKNIDGPALGKLVTLESVTATGVPEATAKPLMGVLEKCRTKGVPSKLLPNFRLSVAAAPVLASAPITAPPSVTKPVTVPTPSPTTAAPVPAPAAPSMIELSMLSVADVATLMTSLNMPSVATIFQSKNIDGPALGKLVTLESVTATGVPEATAKPLMGVLEKCRTKGVPSKLLPNFRLSVAAAPTPASKPAPPLVQDKNTQQLLTKVNQVSENIATAKSTATAPAPVIAPTSASQSAPPSAPSSSSSSTVPLESLTMDQVLKLLAAANLSQFADDFVANKLSGPALSEILTVDDLKECSVKMPGPFARLFIKELSAYREGGVPASKLQ